MEKDLTKITKDEMIQTVNYLVYQNYKWNRKRFPFYTVDQWAKIFGWDAYLMEDKYQDELHNGLQI